jgi:hypothetical protein
LSFSGNKIFYDFDTTFALRPVKILYEKSTAYDSGWIYERDGGMASILIVEDEDAIVELCSHSRENGGHQASILHNGNEAMGFIEKTRPPISSFWT